MFYRKNGANKNGKLRKEQSGDYVFLANRGQFRYKEASKANTFIAFYTLIEKKG